MSKFYTDLIEVDSHFSEAAEQFERLIDGLKGTETLSQEHGEVEKWLSSEGNELLRRLFQAHFDIRTEQETVQVGIECNDEVVRTRRRLGVRRKLSTLFGKIEHHRIGYSSPGTNALYPLDMSLNLGMTKYTDGLRYRVAHEAARNSFDECVETVASTTGGHTPKRQCEEMVAQTAEDFEAYYEATVGNGRGQSNLLVVTTDSKGIVMRREDLRPATRKAAETEEAKKPKARLGPGEKRNRKRMATTAAVYSVDPSVRTAEQVMNASDEDSKPTRVKIDNKRVWASVERGEKAVIVEAFDEAIRRDPEQQRDWVVVVDGEINQLGYIHKTLKAYGFEATIVLDFIHVLEYLWKAAYCFHGVGSEEAEQWVAERALKILRGKSTKVGAGMRRSATRQGLSQTRRKAVDRCAGYLQNNKAYLKYNDYLKAGYPIASGVIEGACRHLINDRLGITGARWGLKTAEAVLKLRSLRSSGDFEEYWKFHKEKEWERNHAAQYKNPELLMAA